MVDGYEWDAAKDLENQAKHGVSFSQAQLAFEDPDRVLMKDVAHSHDEPRYYCFGRVGGGILTVRFTIRNGGVRIIGAGYWRRGRRQYEKKEDPLH